VSSDLDENGSTGSSIGISTRMLRRNWFPVDFLRFADVVENHRWRCRFRLVLAVVNVFFFFIDVSSECLNWLWSLGKKRRNWFFVGRMPPIYTHRPALAFFILVDVCTFHRVNLSSTNRSIGIKRVVFTCLPSLIYAPFLKKFIYLFLNPLSVLNKKINNLNRILSYDILNVCVLSYFCKNDYNL